MDVMLLGASRGVYTAIERMGKSKGGKGGRIVNVASVAGLTVSTLKNASIDLRIRMLNEKQQFLDSKYRMGLQQMLLSLMIFVKTNS